MLLNPYAFGAAGDPQFANVVLLCAFNGTNGQLVSYDDSSHLYVLALVGATLSTARAKFGTASCEFDGANDYVTTTAPQGVGSGLFTMEAHVRPNAAQTGRVISSQNAITPNAVIQVRVNSDGGVTAFIRNNAGGGLLVLSSSAGLIAMDDSAWYHVAVTRDGSNRVDIWVDGVSVANDTSSTSPAGGTAWEVGSLSGSSEFFAGYIDNVRITEGVCRYTGTFTPPSAAYPAF